MVVDTSVRHAIFIVVGFVLNTSRVLLLAVTSVLYGLKVALVVSNIAKFLLCLTRKNLLKIKQTESMKVEIILRVKY